jgi:hypothetical protein
VAGNVDGIEADVFIAGAIWIVPLALMIWLAVASWRERNAGAAESTVGLRPLRVFAVDQRNGQEQDHDRDR